MAADPTSAALEHVLQRFGAMLARAGLERGLGAAELDDLRQDVRIRLWRALEQGERIESIPASYVQRTAVTAALDLIRRRRARRTEPLVEPRDTGDKPIGPSAQVSGPDREFDRDELAECVAGAVDGLADARPPTATSPTATGATRATGPTLSAHTTARASHPADTAKAPRAANTSRSTSTPRTCRDGIIGDRHADARTDDDSERGPASSPAATTEASLASRPAPAAAPAAGHEEVGEHDGEAAACTPTASAGAALAYTSGRADRRDVSPRGDGPKVAARGNAVRTRGAALRAVPTLATNFGSLHATYRSASRAAATRIRPCAAAAGAACAGRSGSAAAPGKPRRPTPSCTSEHRAGA